MATSALNGGEKLVAPPITFDEQHTKRDFAAILEHHLDGGSHSSDKYLDAAIQAIVDGYVPSYILKTLGAKLIGSVSREFNGDLTKSVGRMICEIGNILDKQGE